MTRKHPAAACEQCPLNDDARFVPSEVPDKPRLVVIGEAPGWQEAQYGRPFVGPSGQLLDQVLNHYGYDRSEVMYTNVCLCRPESNATPPKAAIAACRPRLVQEIVESGVQDIVALGGTAADAVTEGGGQITKLRVGPPKPAARDLSGTSNGSSTRVVATWHPAYCLRTSDAFPAFVADLGKLKDPDRPAWQPPTWKYYDEVDQAAAVIDQLLQWQDAHRDYRLVVDIEVGIDKDQSFDHPNEFDLLCVGISYTKGKAVVIGYDPCHDKSVLEKLKQLFRRSKIIAHNGKFDLAGLYPHLGPLELWFDTMLASYALSEVPGGHGLKVLGVEKLGTPEWESEIRKFIPRGGNYGDVPRPILYKYNAYDVAVTWDLYELFEAALDDVPDDWPYETKPRSLRDVHDFMVAASNQLMFLELNGITIDRVYQQHLRYKFDERLGEIERQLDLIISDGRTNESGEPAVTINPRSPKQIKEYLSEQGVLVESTNQATLESIIDRNKDSEEPVIEFIRTLLKHRRQQKLSSTYVEGIRKRMYRGRVYTTYLLHGTTSGRTASRNPNLQNIVRDREIRQQFTVSKPENVFCHGDFRQAEGRVICTLAGDEYLREVFSDPEVDLFNALSDQLYGKGNWRKEVERIRTKAFFYGLGYGREAYSIAQEYGLSVSEANRRLEEFMGLIPATARWQQNVQQRVLEGKDLITPFGRRRRFWLITDQNRKDVLKEALSFLPQSTASDINLDALTHLRPRLRGLGFIRLTIHDALVVECHEDRKEEVAAIMREEMEAAGRRFTDYVPFPVDVTFGKHWGEL